LRFKRPVGSFYEPPMHNQAPHIVAWKTRRIFLRSAHA